MTSSPHPVISRAFPQPQRVPVLYVGGMGRGGSTLLSAVVGGIGSFVPVGELRGVWRALTTGELCGCGLPFPRCTFWSQVGETAFQGWHRVDVDLLLSADAILCRHRNLPLVAAPVHSTIRRRLLKSYLDHLSRLYHAVHEISGWATILDVSKDAPYAFVLRSVPDIDLRLLHLIRDSRAVAFSWNRRVARPEYENIPSLRGTTMDRLSSTEAAVSWAVRNCLFHLLSHSGSPTLRIKYETFVAQPQREANRIARWCNTVVSPERLAMLTQHEYESYAHHTIGGNRIRFARGRLPIQVDDEWVQSMPDVQQRLVTGLTLPLLLCYGYPVRPGRDGTIN